MALSEKCFQPFHDMVHYNQKYLRESANAAHISEGARPTYYRFALNIVYCILHYMRPSVRAIPNRPGNVQSWNTFKRVELHSTGQLSLNQENIRVLPFAISHLQPL